MLILKIEKVEDTSVYGGSKAEIGNVGSKRARMENNPKQNVHGKVISKPPTLNLTRNILGGW